jgi:hypothetical protein
MTILSGTSVIRHEFIFTFLCVNSRQTSFLEFNKASANNDRETQSETQTMDIQKGYFKVHYIGNAILF